MHSLYRLTEAEDWLTAQKTGFFTSPDLLVAGFIHSSPWHEVLTTAALYFADKTELLALEINVLQLQAAGVEVEWVWRAERAETFGHILGPIPVSAVTRVLRVQRTAPGHFAFHPQLVVG